MIKTLLLMASSTAGAGAVWVSYATDFGAGICALLGCVMLQFWTMEVRDPSTRVIAADLMASFISGVTVSVIGVPTCLVIINYFMVPSGTPPELKDTMKIVVAPTKLITATMVLASLSGPVGAGFIRRWMDRLNPEWMIPPKDRGK